MRKKAARIAVTLYLLGAAAILASLFYFGREGVGYLPMIVWALPVAIAGLFAVYGPLGVPFPFMPEALGFYGGHIAFFLPSVALTAWLIWRIVGGRRS